MLRVSSVFVLFGSLCLVGAACQQPTTSGSGGNSGANGGTPGNGGTTSTGGTSSKGGTTGSGGSTSTGGTTGSGGSSNTGGTSSTGGSSAKGGTTGSGGSSSTGGTNNAGGAPARGGTSGGGGSAGNTGGTVGAGGAAKGGTTGTAGSGGSGSGGTTGSGAAGSSGTASCTFTQSESNSTKIGTVGIVTWSTTLTNLSEAHIDFGLDTNYGFTAPVDLKATNYKTLLLGMKANKTYHYRITATGGGSTCTSSDYTLTSGALPNGLAKITAASKSTASPLFGGFLITGQYVQGGGTSGSPAYILDKDTEMVWAYAPGKDVTGARMNYAGTHMWINCANVPSGTTCVHRVTMDGTTDEDVSSKFSGLNHQLTVMPDEKVAFYAYGNTGCDDIKEYDPATGNTRLIVNSGTAQGGNPTACHCNNIEYSKDDDTLVFSELDNQVVVKVKHSDGSTVWVLNGGSKATISGVTWAGGEHGIHLIAKDDMLIFNNNSRQVAGGVGSAGGDGSGSIVIEVKVNESAKTATKPWSYKANPGIQNDIMGDIQRLPNGNTVIGYSTKGVLHEVAADGTLLQELTWPSGASFGYIEKRATLYGPPPK